jgi:hypothetical protein
MFPSSQSVDNGLNTIAFPLALSLMTQPAGDRKESADDLLSTLAIKKPDIFERIQLACKKISSEKPDILSPERYRKWIESCSTDRESMNEQILPVLTALNAEEKQILLPAIFKEALDPLGKNSDQKIHSLQNWDLILHLLAIGTKIKPSPLDSVLTDGDYQNISQAFERLKQHSSQVFQCIPDARDIVDPSSFQTYCNQRCFRDSKTKAEFNLLIGRNNKFDTIKTLGDGFCGINSISLPVFAALV